MDLIQLEKVEILLDSDKTVYQSGDTISGTVNVRLNGELDLSVVKVVLRSMAEVKWMEMYGTIYYREGHVYRDNEMYLNVIYQTPENIRKTELTKGSHSLPFVFKLPDNIPSSVDRCHGFIKYWIEVIINDDSVDEEVYSEYRDKKYLTVETPFRHDLHLSVGSGAEKDIGILCLGSGKVRIDASLSKKGYIKGETLEVHCLVTNTSSLAVTPRASFYETHIFMAKERHITVVHTGEPVIGEKVKAGETKNQTISIRLPKDLSLSIKTRLISFKYFIHVTLDIPFTVDLHVNLPIIITNELALNDRSASFL